MKPTEDLFVLLKNLGKGEKSFLSKTIKGFSKSEFPAHLQLIEILLNMKEYDEKTVVAKLGERANNISYLKNYTYHFVLEILVKHDFGVSQHGILQNEIRAAELLFEKGLYHQSEKLIKKVKKSTLHFGYIDLMHRVLVLEDKLNREEFHLDQLMLLVDKIEEQEQSEIAWLIPQMRMSYNMLSVSVMINPEQHNKVTKDAILKAEELIHLSKKYESLEVKRLSLQLQSLKAALERSVSAFGLIKKTVRFYEQNPSVLQENFHEYMMMNTLYFYIFCKTGNTEAVRNQTSHLQVIINSNQLNLTNHVRVKFLQRVNGFLFHHYIDNGEWELLDAIADQVINQFKENEKELGSLDFMWFCHFCSYYYFTIEDYNNAHHWIYKMINSDFYPERKMSHPVTRIYVLFLLYEMKNYDYLETAIRNETRYFEKIKLEDELEKVIIFYLKRALISPNPNPIFREMKSVLLSKKFKKTLSTNILDCFNIYAWLDSKMEGKTFRECVSPNSFLQPVFKLFMNPKFENKEYA